MNAILSEAAKNLKAQMQAVARFHERFCQRWTARSDATAIRVVGSFLLLPVLLVLSVIASGSVADLAGLVVLAASLAGVAMIFCALSLMGVSLLVLGVLNFAAYGAGVVWLNSTMSAASIAALLVLTLYAASLMGRGFMLNRRAATEIVTEHKFVVAEGDIQLVLDAEGVVTGIDTASAGLLGIAPQTLEGTALIDRIHVADRVQYLSLLADLRSGHKGHATDIRLRTLEEGAPVFLSFRLEGVSANGMMTLIGRSLEGEHRLIEEINALKAQLEAERIGKGRLLATVSHELRTPLNSIIGFSDMLTHEMGCQLQNEKQREYVGLIHKSGHYLLELVNSVLDNSRLETGTYSIEPRSFSFREAADMCAEVMLPLAEKKGIAFCHRVHATTGELMADRRAVQQILLNLAANAVKFTDKGGCVTIDAARVTLDGKPHLEIIIADTGIGIAPEDMQRIGTPFVRADNNYTREQEGSGLGLSVVRGLVELHQGTMQIKSCVGEGTVVTIHLPVSGPQKLLEQDSLGEEDQLQLGTVPGKIIDMHRHQGERINDWQEDENRHEGQERIDAQARKSA